MTLATQAFRPGGSTGKADALKYDAWNRLVEYKDDDSGAVLQKNEYDGLGQRIVRVDAQANPDLTYDYYYNDQWQLLTEVKGSAVEAIYHWHPFYIDALAVRMRASDTHFFLQDANFNVTAAVDDSTNAVVERYSYSPYGQVTVLNPDFSLDSVGGDGLSDIGNTHLYTGRERDPETGLQLNRSRFYARHLGRWVTRDPIVYAGGPNLYEYVLSRSPSSIDPFGLVLITCYCGSGDWFDLDVIPITTECTKWASICCEQACAARDLGGPWPRWNIGPPKKQTIVLPPEPPTDELILGGVGAVIPGGSPIIGGSGKPIIKKIFCSTKKKAKDLARQKSKGKGKPILRHDQGQPPHYHPADDNGRKLPHAEHIYYPWSQF